MRKPSRLVLHVDDHVHHLEPDKAHTCTQAARTSSQHNKEGQRLMDKILHTPKVLSGIRKLGCLAATSMTPSNTPGFNVVWWRNRGGLTCARFCPLEGGFIWATAEAGLCKILSTQRGVHPGLSCVPSILSKSGPRESCSCSGRIWPWRNLCKILSINCLVADDQTVRPRVCLDQLRQTNISSCKPSQQQILSEANIVNAERN